MSDEYKGERMVGRESFESRSADDRGPLVKSGGKVAEPDPKIAAKTAAAAPRDCSHCASRGERFEMRFLDLVHAYHCDNCGRTEPTDRPEVRTA